MIICGSGSDVVVSVVAAVDVVDFVVVDCVLVIVTAVVWSVEEVIG